MVEEPAASPVPASTAASESPAAVAKKKPPGSRRPPASRKGRKARPHGHPTAYRWDTIRLEFTTDPTTSLTSLAKKHGINLGTLQRKSSDERWYDQRAETLDAASRDVQKAAVAQLTSGFRPTAIEAFQQISSLRKRVLELYEKQIDPDSTLPVSSDSVVQVRRDKDAGTLTRTTARRVRPKLDSHLIETLVKIEVQWAAMIFGFHKPGEAERTITVE